MEGTRVTGCLVPPLAGDDDGGEVVAERVVLRHPDPVLDRSLHFARLRPNRSYASPTEWADPPELAGDMYLSLDRPPGRCARLRTPG